MRRRSTTCRRGDRGQSHEGERDRGGEPKRGAVIRGRRRWRPREPPMVSRKARSPVHCGCNAESSVGAGIGWSRRGVVGGHMGGAWMTLLAMTDPWIFLGAPACQRSHPGADVLRPRLGQSGRGGHRPGRRGPTRTCSPSGSTVRRRPGMNFGRRTGRRRGRRTPTLPAAARKRSWPSRGRSRDCPTTCPSGRRRPLLVSAHGGQEEHTFGSKRTRWRCGVDVQPRSLVTSLLSTASRLGASDHVTVPQTDGDYPPKLSGSGISLVAFRAPEGSVARTQGPVARRSLADASLADASLDGVRWLGGALGLR